MDHKTWDRIINTLILINKAADGGYLGSFLDLAWHANQLLHCDCEMVRSAKKTLN